jgi:hypothetical protein
LGYFHKLNLKVCIYYQKEERVSPDSSRTEKSSCG